MTEAEYVKVPTKWLKDLEEARQRLFDNFAPRDGSKDSYQVICKLQESTQVMWLLANTKWEKVDDE